MRISLSVLSALFLRCLPAMATRTAIRRFDSHGESGHGRVQLTLLQSCPGVGLARVSSLPQRTYRRTSVRLRLLPLVLVLAFSSLVARADELYTVAFDLGEASGTYSFVETSIQTAPFTITPDELQSSIQSGATLAAIDFDPTGTGPNSCSSGVGACLELDFAPSSDGPGSIVDSFTNPLTSTGFYVSDGDQFRVTISDDNPPIAATPEPSSLGLLATGLLGVGGILRRRFA